MKPILTFVLGAAAAAGIVFFAMKDPADKPLPEPTAQVQATPAEVVPVPSPIPSQSPVLTDARPARSTERRATPAAKAAPETQVAPSPAPRNDPAPTTVARNEPVPAAPTTQPEPVRAVEERKPLRVPQRVTIPSGTLLSVRIDEELTSATAKPGDSFRASLDQPLVVDGYAIAERGARVEGRVVEADSGGRVRGVSRLSLELVRMTTADGQKIRLQTAPFEKQGEKSVKKDAAKVGIATGIGAAIGAIAGGGKGAAIGAGVGGAAGAGGVMATRGEAARVPAETRMSFRLGEAITVTEQLKN